MSKTLKYLIIGVIVLVVVTIAFVIYRMFFQFNDSKVKQYVKSEADRYGKDSASVYSIIMDSVHYILASHDLTQQVLRNAAANGTDKEQELVHAAVAHCRSFNYLAPVNQ